MLRTRESILAQARPECRCAGATPEENRGRKTNGNRRRDRVKARNGVTSAAGRSPCEDLTSRTRPRAQIEPRADRSSHPHGAGLVGIRAGPRAGRQRSHANVRHSRALARQADRTADGEGTPQREVDRRAAGRQLQGANRQTRTQAPPRLSGPFEPAIRPDHGASALGPNVDQITPLRLHRRQPRLGGIVRTNALVTADGKHALLDRRRHRGCVTAHVDHRALFDQLRIRSVKDEKRNSAATRPAVVSFSACARS
jgi:hypothetical protein